MRKVLFLTLTLALPPLATGEEMADVFPIDQMPPAPVLSPDDALKSFQIEPGFRIELVACEPMIEDPVVVRFDGDGRMWVVELRGYMPNIEGKGEDAPVGRIVILEDTDGDGRMDTSKVFMDGLNQVRAIALVKGGVLFCEPPGLYFVPVDENDQPGERMLIDKDYAAGGNVEHKANGLLPALDNWIYNAKSDRRYRLIGDEWVMDKTESRGQWGITQDDYGRLFYNTNSSGLRGDSVMPSLLMRNPNFKSGESMNRGIGSNRIHAIRPTAGINRGYKPNMLDEQGRLKGFTGASGPCIYRGDQFPAEFYGNGFTPEPCANLIKRFIIEDEDGQVRGRDAYDDRDFLASTDERFRPVSLENGPDGCLYVVDFYRGIIQHKTYVTPYLRRHIEARELDKPIGLGRIYRIVADGEARTVAPKMRDMPGAKLLDQLSSRNGWVRDTAQRLLVQQSDPLSEKRLLSLAGKLDAPLGQLHAQQTLLGMRSANAYKAIEGVAASRDENVRASAAHQLPSLPPGPVLESVTQKLFHDESHAVQLALAFSLGQVSDGDSLGLLADIIAKHPNDKLIRAAAISGLAKRETEFAELLEKRGIDPGGVVSTLRETAIKAQAIATGETHLVGGDLDSFLRGKAVYSKTCFACHGPDGAGVVPLAPPLVNSEWVTGDSKRLAKIILSGLQGPIQVAGKRYAPPDIQPIMPGLALAPDIGDREIADVMNYVRNAWGNKARLSRDRDVAKLRKEAKTAPYTVKELLR